MGLDSRFTSPTQALFFCGWCCGGASCYFSCFFMPCTRFFLGLDFVGFSWCFFFWFFWFLFFSFFSFLFNVAWYLNSKMTKCESQAAFDLLVVSPLCWIVRLVGLFVRLGRENLGLWTLLGCWVRLKSLTPIIVVLRRMVYAMFLTQIRSKEGNLAPL